MNKLFSILFLIFFLNSCNKNTNQNNQETTNKTVVKENCNINKPIAIIILPTDESLKQTKKDIGADNYRIYYDDGASLLNDANIVLKNNNIETIDCYDNETVTFMTKNGGKFEINLANKAFEVLLFNGKEAPKEMFSENLESDESIIKYMK